MRRRVALWNAAFGYGTLAFTLARNILLVPLYLHFVPLGEYGAWLATGGALVQMLVTDYGLGGVVTQRIAVFAGSGDVQRLRALITAGLINAAMLGGFLTAVCSVLAAFLPATQGLLPEQVERVVGCFLIAIIANGLGVLAATTSAAIRGLQKPIAAGAVSLTADVVSTVITVWCLFVGLGLYGLALGLLARSAIAAIGGLGVLAKFWFAHRGAPTPFSWADSLALWRDAGKFFVTSIAMRLQSQANVLLVGAMLGPRTAAIYSLTVRAHETVLVFMWQLNSALGPVLAHMVGAGMRARLDGVIRNLLPLVAAIAAIGAVCTVALNQAFVTLWVGADAFGGITLTILMGCALWTMSVASVAYEALLARGEFSYIARVYAAASVLHLVVLVTLLPSGAWAAPAALCASSVVWGGLFWRRVVTQTGISVDRRVAFLLEPVAIAVTAAITAVLLIVLLPHAATWLALILQGLICAVVVGSTLLIVRPPLRRLVLEEFLTTLRALRPT